MVQTEKLTTRQDLCAEKRWLHFSCPRNRQNNRQVVLQERENAVVVLPPQKWPCYHIEIAKSCLENSHPQRNVLCLRQGLVAMLSQSLQSPASSPRYCNFNGAPSCPTISKLILCSVVEKLTYKRNKFYLKSFLSPQSTVTDNISFLSKEGGL